jgi:hypothetical protein
MGGHLTEGDPGHLETTHEGATTTRYTAAIDQPCRAGITGKQGQAHMISGSLQLRAELGVFFNCLAFALIALQPTFLSHRGGEFAGKIEKRNWNFSIGVESVSRYGTGA